LKENFKYSISFLKKIKSPCLKVFDSSERKKISKNDGTHQLEYGQNE